MRKFLAKLAPVALVAGALGSPAQAQDLTAQISTMTTETAARIAEATVAECRDRGIPVAATVLDRTGRQLVVMRDTMAPDLTLDISQRKAYTALSFNVETSALEGRGGEPIAYTPTLAMFAGGVPVEAGGRVLGSVGVSGAPSGETDQECAQAGVDAVQMDLEMM